MEIILETIIAELKTSLMNQQRSTELCGKYIFIYINLKKPDLKLEESFYSKDDPLYTVIYDIKEPDKFMRLKKGKVFVQVKGGLTLGRKTVNIYNDNIKETVNKAIDEIKNGIIPKADINKTAVIIPKCPIAFDVNYY